MGWFRRCLLLSAAAFTLVATPCYAGGVVIGVAPPAPVIEAVPPPPAVGYVWRPGYWRWNGVRYIWIRGVYVMAPHRGVAWIPGHWVVRGRGWVWAPGHWRR